MTDTAQVTAGKPKVGGHVFRAPLGTTLPTDASTALGDAFKDMGYISSDGVKNNNTPNSETINAWGGTPVLNIQSSREDTYQMKFISALNLEVQKMVYGDDNVSGTLSTGVTVNANAKELDDYVYVIEMIAKGNVLHRVVIPSAHPTSVAEITYVDNDAVGYDVTLSCAADDSGNTHYEYWQTAKA